MAVSILDGPRIREELTRLNLTQRELARRADVPTGQVCRAIAGRPLAPETLFVIARALDRAGRAR